MANIIVIYIIISVSGIFALGFLLLFAFALDSSKNTGTKFYPSGFELFTLNVKILFAPFLKGSGWKKLVKSATPELIVEPLTRALTFTPKLEHIKAFKAVCQLKEEESDKIPFLYPTVVGFYPAACILATPAYPFPLIGSVHTYNTTTLYRPLSEKESFTAVINPSKVLRHVKKGTEVEFVSTWKDKSDSTVWTNSSVFLVMHSQRRKLDSSELNSNTWPEPDADKLSKLFEEVWNLGPNSSLEYAHVSKDYNPIHISSMLAKLFGFPGVIMHGLYMISRAASECQRVMGSDISYPLEVSTKFTRPCVVPQKVTFQVFSINGNRKQLYFSVKGKSEKILLDGYLKAQ